MAWSLPQRRALVAAPSASGGALPSGPKPILNLIADDAVGGANLTSITCRASGLAFTPTTGTGPAIDLVSIAPHKLLTWTTILQTVENLAASAVAGKWTGIQPYTSMFYVRVINIAGTRTFGALNISAGNSRLNWKGIGASPACNLRNVRANSAADVNYDDTGNTLSLSPTKMFLTWVFDGVNTTIYRDLTSLGVIATPQSVGAGADRLIWCGTTPGAATNTSQMAWQGWKVALSLAQLTTEQAKTAALFA